MFWHTVNLYGFFDILYLVVAKYGCCNINWRQSMNAANAGTTMGIPEAQ